MATLNFDAEAMSFVAAAPSDPEAAALALRLIASYIREGRALPNPLAGHLAGAIEAAMSKPSSHRGKALARELHLTALNARPKGDAYEIGTQFETLRANGETVERAYAKLAAEHKMSPETAKRRVRAYLEGKRICHD